MKNALASLAGLASVVALAMTACSSGPDPKMAQKKDDGVPANSASEERLNGGTASGAAKKDDTKTTSAEDPTQPYTQPVVAGGDGTSGSGPTAKGGGPKEAKDPKAPKETGKGGKDKVSKAECTRALDRFLDLMVASDSRFEGIPPEMIAQMKQQGFSQVGGANPCDGQGITRTQYDCAIGASTTAAWQRCMPK